MGLELLSWWLQVSFYHRNVARQQQQMQQWLQKRRQENATRRLAGEEPLPEEDPALFKPIPEPSPLDVYLINNQVGLPQYLCPSMCPVDQSCLEHSSIRLGAYMTFICTKAQFESFGGADVHVTSLMMLMIERSMSYAFCTPYMIRSDACIISHAG